MNPANLLRRATLLALSVAILAVSACAAAASELDYNVVARLS